MKLRGVLASPDLKSLIYRTLPAEENIQTALADYLPLLGILHHPPLQRSANISAPVRFVVLGDSALPALFGVSIDS